MDLTKYQLSKLVNDFSNLIDQLCALGVLQGDEIDLMEDVEYVLRETEAVTE